MTQVRHGWFTFASALALAGGLCGCSSPWAGWGWLRPRSEAIPDVLPLGSVVRAHNHTMQTNGEAADFIFHRHDFAGATAELTPAGKDRLLEIAARARSAPFPILVERSENNSDPELDAHRRNLIARIMNDLGVPEADQRVIVSPAYGRGYTGIEAAQNYGTYLNAGNGLGYGGYGTGYNNGFGGGTGGAGVGFF